MQRLNSFIHWLSLSSGVTHIFCCGLPAVFSILSLLSGLGIVAAMPTGLEHIHHMMHDYEMAMLLFSGCILLFGWALHYIAYRIDCQTHGCCHEPCKPKKTRSAKILILATVLFAVNLTIYFTYHC